jgi:hypothetical protein
MNTLLALALLALPQQPPKEAPLADWKGYNAGVRWEPSVEAAMRRAAELRRPLMLYQLVGNLAKEGC